MIATALLARSPSAWWAVILVSPAVVGTIFMLTRAFRRPRPIGHAV
jgi:hypothetical protein